MHVLYRVLLPYGVLKDASIDIIYAFLTFSSQSGGGMGVMSECRSLASSASAVPWLLVYL